MNKKLAFFTSILSVCIFITGCFAGLNQYQPKSVEEEAVIKVVMAHERTWNEHDASGFLETFHESAKIELGCDGILLSKNDFATHIPQLMSDYPRVKLVNPSVDVSEKNAVAKVTSTRMGDENHIFKIEMLNENDQWYIIQETCH
jgi:hypothetical protein